MGDMIRCPKCATHHYRNDPCPDWECEPDGKIRKLNRLKDGRVAYDPKDDWLIELANKQQQEIDSLYKRQRSDEEQLCRIANFLGRDARHAPKNDTTIAGLVIDEINQLKNLVRELVPFLEAAMPEISAGPFPGPDAQLDCDDMNLAFLCEIYHRAKKAAE